MKKMMAGLLCLLLLCTLSACGKKETGLANPMTEYASLEELNAAAGTNLKQPQVMGVSEEGFFTIDGGDYVVAQYNFTVAGVAYTLRCAPTSHDISGYYINGEPAYEEGFADGIEYVDAEDAKLARWATLEGQFVLAGVGAGENFTDIAEEIAGLHSVSTTGGVDFASLPGEYQDATSQRAVMTVTDNGDDTVHILVHWSSSADEYNQWEMNGKLGEDGLLYYSDCTESVITTAEDGTETVNDITVNGIGFFSPAEDGTLYWNGADDESCIDCAFEKVA